MKKSKIAVLIPCYNESATIEKVVKDYKKALPDADIYVYDNNSKDHTDEIAKKAGAIVKYEYRQGKGNVIRSMFRDIDADCYLMIDGDDTYPAENAKEMCDLVLSGKADMVIGDRLSYEFVKGFPVLSKGFEIETEMTIHAVDKNFKLIEIPVEYRDRPAGSHSKLNTFSDGYKVLRTIATLFKEYKPVLFFNIIALIFLLLGFVISLPAFIGYFQTGLVEKFPSLIVGGFLSLASMLSVSTGMILGVIAKKHKQLYELYMNTIYNNKKRD